MSEPDGSTSGLAPGLSDVRCLDSDSVLDQLAGERAVAAAAEARVLALAVHYVDLHPVTDTDLPARPDGPDRAWGDVTDAEPAGVAGAGTPAVADYAVEALGAVLDVPYGAAWSLVADSAGLFHRLPRLWARTQAGTLQAWRARAVARETAVLSQAAAGFVDRQLAILVDRRRWLSRGRLRDLVHEAALLDDPDREKALEEAALGRLGVWFEHHADTAATSVTHLAAILEASDAHDLDAALDDLADTMGRLGDTTSVDNRRAAALVLLAHPQRLLDLATGTHPPDPTASTDTLVAVDRPLRPGTGTTTGSRSTVNLFVHATLADLAALTHAAGPRPATERETAGGYGLAERFGPAALDIVGHWANRCERLVIRPVLDPTSVLPGPDHTGSPPGMDGAAVRPLDRHDPPGPMREHVVLRDGACVFPGCQVDARRTDLDHIEPYTEPPGEGAADRPPQTHPANLACLCRRHHRLKTFTAWDYARLDDGSYLWTDPAGRTYRTYPLPRRAAVIG